MLNKELHDYLLNKYNTDKYYQLLENQILKYDKSEIKVFQELEETDIQVFTYDGFIRFLIDSVCDDYSVSIQEETYTMIQAALDCKDKKEFCESYISGVNEFLCDDVIIKVYGL